MEILNRRIVISKGSVPRPGQVHISAGTGSEISNPLPIGPVPNSPLQQIWWTGLANLPGLVKFNVVTAHRAPLSAGSDWNRFVVRIRSNQTGAAKAAIQVYAAPAEVRNHNANATLGRGDASKLHTNDGAGAGVTLRLPNATAALRGAELYFEVRSNGNNLVVEREPGGVGNPADVIEVGGADRATATANVLGEKLVISWEGPNRWRVTDQTGGWAFA